VLVVARYADASNFGPSGATGSAWGIADIRRKYGVLRAHCAAIGRPDDSVLRTFSVSVMLAQTAAGVQASWTHVQASRRPKNRNARACRERLQTFFNLPVPEKIPLLIVAGTPEEMVNYCQAVIDAGVQYVIVPGGDPETVRHRLDGMLSRARRPAHESDWRTR